MAHNALETFLKDIPEDRLRNFPSDSKTIWGNDDLQLDMQGMTSNDRYHNLQIQVNKETGDVHLRKFLNKRYSLSVVLTVPSADPNNVWSAFQESFNLMIESAKIGNGVHITVDK